MAFGDIPNSERIVISINSSLRFGQIVVGAATIGLYAPEKGFWVNQGLPDKIVSARVSCAKEREKADLPS